MQKSNEKMDQKAKTNLQDPKQDNDQSNQQNGNQPIGKRHDGPSDAQSQKTGKDNKQTSGASDRDGKRK